MAMYRAVPPVFLIVSSAALSLLFFSQAVAQTDSYQGWDAILDESYVENPDRQALKGFRISESWKAKLAIDKAKLAIEAGDFSRAVIVLQDVIENHQADVFQAGLDYLPGSKSCARFVGAAELAHYLLAALPEEGRQEYDSFVSKKAAGLLDEAVAKEDIVSLKRIGESFSASITGRRALRFLAEYHLERGEAELASIYLKKVLLFLSDDGQQQDLLRRLVQSLLQLGRRDEAALFIDAMGKGAPPDQPFDRVSLDLQRGLASLAPDGADSGWSTCGGGNNRSKTMSLLMDAAEFTPQWSGSFICDVMASNNPFEDFNRSSGTVPFKLMRKGDVLVFNGSVSATALNIYTGEVLWRFDGPLDADDDLDAYYNNPYYVLEDYLSYYGVNSSTTISPHIIAGGTVAGDRVLVNLQARRRRMETKMLSRRVINRAIPRRGLFAINMTDGSLDWAQGDPVLSEDDFLGRVSIPSPPVVINDLVICNAYLREGGINAFVLYFDLESGRMIRKVPVGIGQQELTMFNMEYKEFSAIPLTEVEGTLICCSNLGFVCALDALSGRIRWITEYETIPLPKVHSFNTLPQPRRVNWENNPPQVCGDAVVVTPLDSDKIIAFNWRTGASIWKKTCSSLGVDMYRSLLGVHEGKFILTGPNGATALDAEQGARKWRVTLPAETEARGRGALTGDSLYLQAGNDLFVYDLESGKALKRVDLNSVHKGCGLFLFGEVIALAGAGSLEVMFDAGSMLARAESRLDEGGNVFDDLVFIGDMSRLDGRHEKAVTSYEAAIEKASVADVNVRPSTLERVQNSLFDAYVALGRKRWGLGLTSKAEADFRSALDIASSPEQYVSAALTWIDLLGSGRVNARGIESVLDGLMTRHARHRYPFHGREGLEEALVGLYVSLVRCRLARERADPTEEIAHLQSVLEDYPDDGIEAVRAGEFAFSRIRELIEENGREIFAGYDSRARSMFEKALTNGSISNLERTLALYPNAEIAGRITLEIAGLYIGNGEADPAYRALSGYLQSHKDTPHVPHALFLMARAAKLEGNTVLHRSIEKRLLQSYSGVEAPGEGGKSYEDILSDAYQAELPAGPAELLPREEYEVSSSKIRSRLCSIVPVDGMPSPLMEGKVLLDLESEMDLMLFDFNLMEEAWRLSLDRFLGLGGGERLSKAVQMNGVIAAVYETRVIGISIASGQLMWIKELPMGLRDAAYSSGLLFILSEAQAGIEEDEKAMAMAVNPVTGSLLWQKEIDVDANTAFIPSAESFAFVSNMSRFGRWNSTLLTFDPFTGEQWKRVSLPDVKLTPVPLAAQGSALLVVESRETERDGRREISRTLKSFGSRHGTLLWSLPLDDWLIDFINCAIVDNKPAFYAIERFRPDRTSRGQRSLLLVDPAEGGIAEKVPFPQQVLAFLNAASLPGSLVYTYTKGSRRMLRLSAFDTRSKEFQFRDQTITMGNASTLDVHLRAPVYAADGLIIPIDFDPKGTWEPVLCSQVLLLDKESGRLLHSLDLCWKSQTRMPSHFSSHFPVQTMLKNKTVLVLKSSELYVIQGSGAGG